MGNLQSVLCATVVAVGERISRKLTISGEVAGFLALSGLLLHY